jgi:two-component system cell cycle sensor histidine kinase/response regulator CckA
MDDAMRECGSRPRLGERHAAPREALAQLTGGIKILLVEDNDDVRRAITRILESLGNVVVVARDGVEAIERLQDASSVDVVVTDVLMPRIGGIELVERLRVIDPLLPVVFMSGYPGPESNGTIVMDEQTVFLQKPFDPGELAEAVAGLAAKPEPGRD